MHASSCSLIRVSTAVSTAILALSCAVAAQGPLPDAPLPSLAAVVPVMPVAQPRVEVTHKFWDKQNKFLFIAASAGAAADFAVTRANLQSGGRELNPMVRPFGHSSAGLAMNFAGETGRSRQSELLLPKNRPPQNGTRRVDCEHRGICDGCGYGLIHQ